MKILSSFMVMNMEGANRLSFTYNEVDEESGNIIGTPLKESFVVLDSSIIEHIESIRNYIREKRLN